MMSQALCADDDTAGLIDISYPVSTHVSIEVMKQEWLTQFLQEYPGSSMLLDNIAIYVVTERDGGGKLLTVSCSPEDFLVPTPILIKEDYQVWLGMLGCNTEQLEKFRLLAGSTAIVESLAEVKDVLSFTQTPEWIALQMKYPKIKGYQVQCQDDQLVWNRFDGVVAETEWDASSFPYVKEKSDVVDDMAGSDYLVQVQLMSQSEAMELLMALKKEDQLESMEIVGSNKGLYTFSFRLKGRTPEGMDLWTRIEKIEGKHYRAQWGSSCADTASDEHLSYHNIVDVQSE